MARAAYTDTRNVSFPDRRVAQGPDRQQLLKAQSLIKEALNERNERQFVHKVSQVFKITRDIARDYTLN